MNTLPQVTWMTLWGLSLLFVGGFVLWVYSAQKMRVNTDIPTYEMVGHFKTHLVQWFVLYGAVATFAGAGCLLTAAIMVL